jgi:hypothetical protein
MTAAAHRPDSKTREPGNERKNLLLSTASDERGQNKWVRVKNEFSYPGSRLAENLEVSFDALP